MKKFLLPLMLVLMASFASAGVSVDYAYIRLNKINVEPEITAIGFSTEELLAKTSATCIVNVIDENPDAVDVKTEWYVNGEKVHEGLTFSGFRRGDIVECLATPVDAEGLEGSAKGYLMKAQPRPIRTAVASDLKGGPAAAFALVGIIGFGTVAARRKKLF
jgi:hypothetical protein